MKRSISTALALTLGLAVSTAVVVTVFAQKDQSSAPPSASVPARDSGPAATGSHEVVPAPRTAPAPASAASGSENGERNSTRTGSLSISVSETTNPSTFKETKLPEIDVDSSNVITIPKSSVKPFRESRRELTLTSSLPASSLAAEISDANAETVETWRPAYASQGFLGARLDAFAVSQDGTVLAIAERTGNANGPNGTRIILVNTSDWQVIRTFTTDRMLKRLAFDETLKTLAAVAYPQQALLQKFGVLHLDPKSGKTVSFYELPFPFNEKIAPEQIALLTAPNGVFCSGFFGSKVFFIPHAARPSDEVPYTTFDTTSPSSALAITPDGNSIAAASMKAIEYFSLNAKDIGARRQSITTIDLGWAPVDLHFLGGAGTDFIVCPAFRENSPPVIIRSSARESLDGRSAGFAIPMHKNTLIGVAYKTKGRIDVIDPLTLKADDSVILEQLRPATTGDSSFVFFNDAIRAFCVIDTNGNCFAVGKREGEKHWTKRIIWNGAGKR